ncbi:MAG: hypothetical protein GF329_05650 [Candidatus Lokiarchaeota archaeon]|nr:hypothetical protein [Candidatus Lokiarchaeota archaeon]
MEIYWWFQVLLGQINASNESPTNNSFICDSSPRISVNISSVYPIDNNSIVLTVNGSTVNHSVIDYTPNLFEVYYDSPIYNDGVIVNIRLNCNDTSGNKMDEYAWSFTIDTEDPELSNQIPPLGSYTTNTTPLIRANLIDQISDINESSIIFDINGTLIDPVNYTYDSASGNLTYTPTTYDPFVDGNLSISIQVSDNANNTASTQWYFYIDSTAPSASSPSPTPESYINDETPTIQLIIEDNLSGVDDSSIILDVNGSIISSSEYSYSGLTNTLTYTPGSSLGEGLIIITVDSSDLLANTMASYSWNFTIDITDPIASNENPVNLSTITDDSPDISVNLADGLSGIDNDSIILTVAGSVRSHDWNGSIVNWSGLLSDGVINVRLDASDMAGNSIIFTWLFTIDTTGPIASNEDPVNNSLTNDVTPTISVNLTDTISGVDSSTIVLTVNGEVVSHNYVSNSVSWTNTTSSANGYIFNVDLDASDNVGNVMLTYSWSFTIDTVAPTIDLSVNDTYSTDEAKTIDITINVTSNENLSTVILDITQPDSTVQNIPMNQINGTYWQLIYEVTKNGTHIINAFGYDLVGNIGNDTASFDAIYNDINAPNFTVVFSNPMNLLYNQSSVPTNWSTYPESAGANVNITIQFSESIISSAINDVNIFYKASTETTWTSISMTDLGSKVAGSDRLDSFSFLMPAYRNGTTVNFTITAKDAANNEFQLNASGYNYGYFVLGNWLENITINKPVPEGILHNSIFSISANISFRNDVDYLLQVHARIHDPQKANLEPTIESNYTIYNNTMEISKTGTVFTWAYPYPENISYGMMIFLSFQVFNNATKTIEQIGYNGGYYLSTPFVYMASIIDQDIPNIHTPVVSSDSPNSNTAIDINFEIMPENDTAAEIDTVRVYYRIDGGEYMELVPIIYDGNYSVVIPGQSANSMIEYYIVVKDKAGNTYTSQVYSITVQSDSYLPYILLAVIAAVVLIGIVVVILRNKSKVKKATGKERYKYIKKKIGGK